MLETRTVSGTIHKTSGEVWPFAEVTFKLRRDAAGDGIVVPQFPEVVTADEDGVFECELYTITDGFLPYRCTLPNGKGFKFDLPPGDEITLDVLMDLGELDDSDSVQAAFINALTLALIWENITGKPSTFPPATHNHNDLYFTESEVNALVAGVVSDVAYNPSSWNGVSGVAPSQNVTRDKFVSVDASIAVVADQVGTMQSQVSSIESDLGNKQNISEKNQLNGYVGIDGNGFIDPLISKWNCYASNDTDLRATRIISKEWYSKPLLTNYNIRVDKGDGYSNIRLASRDGDPVLDAIWSDTGGNFIDGDEILILNILGEPVRISPLGPTSDGKGIYTGTGGEQILWPDRQAVKFIFDGDQDRFRAVPMFSFAELAFGLIDGNTDIGSSNYHQWHGKLNRVTGGTILLYNDIPDGFRADFEADTSGDVTFTVDGDTIRNRQGHTKIAGEYGVVTVYKRGGYFYLVGDTKA